MLHVWVYFFIVVFLVLFDARGLTFFAVLCVFFQACCVCFGSSLIVLFKTFFITIIVLFCLFVNIG